jgi:subtilase family serine protease
MRKPKIILLAGVVLLGVLAPVVSSAAAPAKHPAKPVAAQAAKTAVPAAKVNAVAPLTSCPTDPRPGYASCYSKHYNLTGGAGGVTGLQDLGATPYYQDPLVPADFKAAYNLPSFHGGGQTVGIVDAYGYPRAEYDMNVYRQAFHLPACTTANGCFKKVDQNGGKRYPHFDAGWAGETALDLDMVSAVCPHCKIVLVEANSNSSLNLGTAVNRAIALKAREISNSYGSVAAKSARTDAMYGRFYNHPSSAIVASTGDYGYEGPSFPASSHYVTAVGGTALLRAPGLKRGYSETAWNDAGSGCSTANQRIAGQFTVGTQCTGKASSDVSAVASCSTPVAVYTPVTATTSEPGAACGTSAASPIIASIFALAGQSSKFSTASVYAHRGALFDITTGHNGICVPRRWCTAGKGWDGPTGLGTPNGIGAF